MASESKTNAWARLREIPEALLIAALTVASYATAYAYEVGYAHFFAVPTEFIQLSLEVVLRAGAGVLFFLYFLLQMLNLPIILLNRELRRPDDLRRRTLMIHLLFLGLFIVLVRGFGFSWWGFGLAIALIAMIDFFLLLVPFMSDRSKNPEPTAFFSRIERAVASGKLEGDVYSELGRLVGRESQFLLFLGLPVAILIAYSAGVGSARESRVFRISSQEATVLVRRYQDTYIFKPLDIKTNTLRNEVLVRTPEQVSGQMLARLEIKNLRVDGGMGN